LSPAFRKPINKADFYFGENTGHLVDPNIYLALLKHCDFFLLAPKFIYYELSTIFFSKSFS